MLIFRGVEVTTISKERTNTADGQAKPDGKECDIIEIEFIKIFTDADAEKEM